MSMVRIKFLSGGNSPEWGCLARSPETPPRNSLLSCGNFGDLESEHGGFPLEKVDLMLAMLELVDLGSFVDVFHPIAQHVVHQTGQLGCHGFGCHRCA